MKKSIIKKNIISIATIVSIAVVTLLSLIKLPEFEAVEIDNKSSYIDKIVHVCFYFTLNFMILTLCLEKFKIKRLFSMLMISLGVIAYGCVIEIIQYQIGRECSVYDVIANSCGVTLALFIFRRPAVNREIMKITNKR